MSKEEILDNKFKIDSGSKFDDYFRDSISINISQDAEVFKHTIYDAMDEYYNQAIDDAIVVVRERWYMEDSPLWNLNVDKTINQLQSLKK